MYSTIKSDYKLEPYLCLIKGYKYRQAFARFRASSHTLEIERGRYTRPVTDVQNRICQNCRVIENEIHFLLDCPLYATRRERMISNVASVEPDIHTLTRDETFTLLLTSENPMIVTWVGKFLHHAFIQRNSHQPHLAG